MKAKVALIVAVVLGLFAAMVARNYLQRKREESIAQIKPTRVVVAAEQLRAGKELKLEQLAGKDIPEDAVTRDHILWRDHPLLVRQKLGRNVERGEFILRSFVLTERRDVAALVAPGQVAMALRVDDVSGVAGAIRPGDHVDIYSTLPVGGAPTRGSAGEMSTWRLLADCTVLAVDNRTTVTEPALSPYGRGMQGYSTVTLALTPEEAAIVMFVQGQGQVQLALRNRDDVLLRGEPEPQAVTLQNVVPLAQRANAARRSRQAPPEGAAPIP